MKLDEINFYGWSNPYSGYGIVSVEYATAIQRQGVEVYYGWERQEDMLKEHYEVLTDEQKTLLTKPFKKTKVGIIKTTPQLFHKNKSDFRIGYTMVENTKIGENWVKLCNNMDAMFVPSQFLVNVFKECGVTRPIKVVKQGVDSRKFPYIERIPKSKFIFGTVGYIDERKNWQDLVQAFCSEFETEDVELWIKNSNPYFKHKSFTDKRIKVINRSFTYGEIQKLYTLFDCFVFPSHAEGSGLPPREAMATGLPVIVTNWSGLTEVALPEISYPLTPTTIDMPDIRGPEQPGYMARISVEELMYQMRYVYEHQAEAKQKGKKASEFIHKEWSWDVCAKDLIGKVEELI